MKKEPRQKVSDFARTMHEQADKELAERLNLDIKGDPNDVFKAAVEKAIPQRVKLGISPETGARTQTIVSNKDREPGK